MQAARVATCIADTLLIQAVWWSRSVACKEHSGAAVGCWFRMKGTSAKAHPGQQTEAQCQ